MPSSPVAYSTERTIHKPVHNNTATPSGPTKRKSNMNLQIYSKGRKTFVKFEEPIVRRSDRIETARRVKKTRPKGIFLNQKFDRSKKGPITNTFQGFPHRPTEDPGSRERAQTTHANYSYPDGQIWFP